MKLRTVDFLLRALALAAVGMAALVVASLTLLPLQPLEPFWVLAGSYVLAMSLIGATFTKEPWFLQDEVPEELELASLGE